MNIEYHPPCFSFAGCALNKVNEQPVKETQKIIALSYQLFFIYYCGRCSIDRWVPIWFSTLMLYNLYITQKSSSLKNVPYTPQSRVIMLLL